MIKFLRTLPALVVLGFFVTYAAGCFAEKPFVPGELKITYDHGRIYKIQQKDTGGGSGITTYMYLTLPDCTGIQCYTKDTTGGGGCTF